GCRRPSRSQPRSSLCPSIGPSSRPRLVSAPPPPRPRTRLPPCPQGLLHSCNPASHRTVPASSRRQELEVGTLPHGLVLTVASRGPRRTPTQSGTKTDVSSSVSCPVSCSFLPLTPSSCSHSRAKEVI